MLLSNEDWPKSYLLLSLVTCVLILILDRVIVFYDADPWLVHTLLIPTWLRLHAICSAMHPEVVPLPDRGLLPLELSITVNEQRASSPRDESSGRRGGYFRPATSTDSSCQGSLSTLTDPYSKGDPLLRLANFTLQKVLLPPHKGGSEGPLAELSSAVCTCLIQRLQVVSEQAVRLGSRCLSRAPAVGVAKGNNSGVKGDTNGGDKDAGDEDSKEEEEEQQEEEAGQEDDLNPSFDVAAGAAAESCGQEASALSEALVNLTNLGSLPGTNGSGSGSRSVGYLQAVLWAIPLWAPWVGKATLSSFLAAVMLRPSLPGSSSSSVAGSGGVVLLAFEELVRLPSIQKALPEAVEMVMDQLVKDQVNPEEWKE